MCALKKLENKTYVLQHNPNCASPYLIRLPGDQTGGIDLLPYSEPSKTKDKLFFGKTLDEAVEQAVA